MFRQYPVELMEQQLPIRGRPGAPGSTRRRPSVVGTRTSTISIVGELRRDAVWRQPGRTRHGQILQGDAEDMRLDAVLALVEHRSDAEVVLELLERAGAAATRWPIHHLLDTCVLNTRPASACPAGSAAAATVRTGPSPAAPTAPASTPPNCHSWRSRSAFGSIRTTSQSRSGASWTVGHPFQHKQYVVRPARRRNPANQSKPHRVAEVGLECPPRGMSPKSRDEVDRDDSSKPEFATWQSYQRFAHRVRHGRRFVWEADVRAFLDTVAASVNDRDVTVPMGKILYRAQQGVRTVDLEDEDGHTIVETVAFCAERMKPRTDRASEGRANAAGIPVLYLAGARETAIAEVRPWLGAEVSVAQFRVLRDLRIVDLTRGHGQSSVKKMIMERPIRAGEPTPKKRRTPCGRTSTPRFPAQWSVTRMQQNTYPRRYWPNCSKGSNTMG